MRVTHRTAQTSNIIQKPKIPLEGNATSSMFNGWVIDVNVYTRHAYLYNFCYIIMIIIIILARRLSAKSNFLLTPIAHLHTYLFPFPFSPISSATLYPYPRVGKSESVKNELFFFVCFLKKMIHAHFATKIKCSVYRISGGVERGSTGRCWVPNTKERKLNPYAACVCIYLSCGLNSFLTFLPAPPCCVRMGNKLSRIYLKKHPSVFGIMYNTTHKVFNVHIHCTHDVEI